MTCSQRNWKMCGHIENGFRKFTCGHIHYKIGGCYYHWYYCTPYTKCKNVDETVAQRPLVYNYLLLISELIVTHPSYVLCLVAYTEKHCYRLPRNYWNVYCANAFAYSCTRIVQAAASFASTLVHSCRNLCGTTLSSSSFYLPNNTTVCTSTSIQLRRSGQQGPTRTLTAALKRLIKQLLGTSSITQVKYYKQTRKLEKSMSVLSGNTCPPMTK